MRRTAKFCSKEINSQISLRALCWSRSRQSNAKSWKLSSRTLFKFWIWPLQLSSFPSKESLYHSSCAFDTGLNVNQNLVEKNLMWHVSTKPTRTHFVPVEMRYHACITCGFWTSKTEVEDQAMNGVLPSSSLCSLYCSEASEDTKLSASNYKDSIRW